MDDGIRVGLDTAFVQLLRRFRKYTIVDCQNCPAGWPCDDEKGCRPMCRKNPDCGDDLFCVGRPCTATVPYYPVDPYPDGDDDVIESEPVIERDPNAPWIVLIPTLLDFGAVNHGGSATADLLITNYGGADLTISNGSFRKTRKAWKSCGNTNHPLTFRGTNDLRLFPSRSAWDEPAKPSGFSPPRPDLTQSNNTVT